MQTNLNNILTQTDDSVTFIVYAPAVDGFDRALVEKGIRDLVSESGFSHSYDLKFVGDHESADNKWGADLLSLVAEDHGVVVIFSKTDSVQVVECYSPEKVQKLRADEKVATQLYAHCLMVGEATEPSLPSTAQAEDAASEARLKPNTEVLAELEVLNETSQLFSTAKLAVYLFKGREAPAMMQLIGAARAVTFAAIGAGAGVEIDLSDEDDYYDHLLLWDREQNCLVGAYRLGFTNEILETHGKTGMYLDHVFEIEPEFYETLGNAMELSRSFLLPSYQKNPQMLDALWKGIGHASIEKNCHILYGSVTISASYTPLSQAILVDTLDRYHSEDVELRNAVRSKVPFKAETQHE